MRQKIKADTHINTHGNYSIPRCAHARRWLITHINICMSAIMCMAPVARFRHSGLLAASVTDGRAGRRCAPAHHRRAPLGVAQHGALASLSMGHSASLSMGPSPMAAATLMTAEPFTRPCSTHHSVRRACSRGRPRSRRRTVWGRSRSVPYNSNGILELHSDICFEFLMYYFEN